MLHTLFSFSPSDQKPDLPPKSSSTSSASSSLLSQKSQPAQSDQLREDERQLLSEASSHATSIPRLLKSELDLRQEDNTAEQDIHATASHDKNMGGARTNKKKKGTAATNPSPSSTNGKTVNGVYINGEPIADVRSRDLTSSRGYNKQKSKATPATSFQVWFLGILCRLIAWYALYTVLFTCPVNPGKESPVICTGYRKIHDVLAPHIQPYYDTYGAPYVEKASPFIVHANQAYIYPAYETASANYNKYAQPSILKAKNIVEQEYKKQLQPHVKHATKYAQALYKQHLAPHSKTVEHLYKTAASSPQWKNLQANVRQIYNLHLIPAYKRTQPYIQRVYENGKFYAIVVIGPHIKDGIKISSEWFQDNVWSNLIILWKDYAEVQVERIKDRITTGHSGSDSLASAISSMSVSASKAGAVSSASASAYISSVTSSAKAARATEADSEENETPEQKIAREAARKQIEQDLASYNDKFNKHARDAIESLNRVVEHHATTAYERKKPDVEKQLKDLDNLMDKEYRELKATIINLAKGYKPDASAEEKERIKLDSFDKLFDATRNAGVELKDIVQEMRWDSHRFLAALYDEVAAAADTHTEKIDEIIDSGIQELGIKWAWNDDHVHFKDWAKYQDLKKEFAVIRNKVLRATEKNAKLAEVAAWAEGETWEEGANKRAAAAASELARLKRIGKRKIEVGDYSDDFSDSILSSTVGAVKQQILDTKDSVEAAVESASSRVAEAVSGERTTPSAETIPEKIQKQMKIGKAEAAAVPENKEDYEVEDPLADTVTEKLKDSVEDIKGALEHASRAVSEAIYGTKTTQPAGESITSVASEMYSSALDAASRALYGTPQPAGESVISIATDKYSAAVAAASSIIYGTPAPTSWSDKASDAYGDAVFQAAQAYQKAIHELDLQVNGREPSVRESIASTASQRYKAALVAAQDKYQQALNQASTAIYGAPQPTLESIMSVASQKYDDAVWEAQKTYYHIMSRASTIVYGTPTPAAESIASAISEKVEKAKSVASEGIYGTPQPVSESIISRASEVVESIASAASANVETAQSAVSETIDTAANVVAGGVGAAAGVVGEGVDTATSIVGEGVDTASSIVAKGYSSASSVVISVMTPPPALESIISAANAQANEIVDAVSVAIYGTSKGTIEKATSAASDAAASAASAVSSAIYGRETGALESAVSRLSAAAAQASTQISIAVYGEPEKTGIEYATQVVADQASAAASVIAEKYEDAKAAASRAVYGEAEEKYYAGLVESAQARLADAVQSASSRLTELFEETKTAVPEAVQSAKSVVGSVVEEVSKVVVIDTSSTTTKGKVEQATEVVKDKWQSVKDEL